MTDSDQDSILAVSQASSDREHSVGETKLTGKTAQELEDEIVLAPTAEAPRKQLLELYGEQNTTSAALAALPHIHWMIDNCPGEYFPTTLPFTEEQRFEIKNHYIQSVQARQDKQEVVGRFALALKYWQDPMAEEFLRKAHQVNPKKIRWAWELASFYQAQARIGRPECQLRYAQLCVSQTEKCLKLKITRGDRIGLITEFTSLAIEFEFFSQARKWSRSLLSIGNSGMKWLSLLALLYLARIEILEGNYKNGKCFLNSALKLFRRERISYFAGSIEMMRLLDLLLSEGKEKVVLRTLEICLPKCEQPEETERIQTWLAQLQNGEHPQFTSDYCAMKAQ